MPVPPSQSPLPWPRSAVLAAARTMAGADASAPALMSVLAEPTADGRRVVAAIHRAPGVALRILKVANSAFYGRAGQVDTLDRAVQVLGLDAVRTMACAACLDRLMPGESGPGPAAAELLDHSLASAALAGELARLLLPERVADAFLAGLLHDLGYRVVRRLADRADDPDALARRWHGPCAAQVFEAWNLPGWLGEVVGEHHRSGPEVSAQAQLARIVTAADRMAIETGHGLGLEPPSADDPWPLPELTPDSAPISALRQRCPQLLAALGAVLA